MINVRIYNSKNDHIWSICWKEYSIMDKFSLLYCLDKSFAFARARFGVNKYQFAFLETIDSRDYAYISGNKL